MRDKTLAISIVLYKNHETEIQRFLNNIPNYVKLYIVDNSIDESLSKFFFDNKKFEYIFNNKNIGYGRAHNLAIKRSVEEGYEYHLIANTDVQFNSMKLDKLLVYMNSDTKIGLCMPRVIYRNGDLQYLCKLLPTPLDLFGRRFLPKRIIKRINDKYEMKFTNYDKIMEVPYLSGCFMLCRNIFLKQVKGFDESFFMYCEDIDLSRRLNRISRTMYFPEVTIIHDHSRESFKYNKMLLAHILSAIKYFNKWGWFFDSERKSINSMTINNNSNL